MTIFCEHSLLYRTVYRYTTSFLERNTHFSRGPITRATTQCCLPMLSHVPHRYASPVEIAAQDPKVTSAGVYGQAGPGMPPSSTHPHPSAFSGTLPTYGTAGSRSSLLSSQPLPMNVRQVCCSTTMTVCAQAMKHSHPLCMRARISLTDMLTDTEQTVGKHQDSVMFGVTQVHVIVFHTAGDTVRILRVLRSANRVTSQC